jgi:hypothetical protein
MGGWVFWDWVAYATLWIAAIAVALEAALKQVPDARRFLAFTRSPWWGFAPLALLLFGAIIFVVRSFSFVPAVVPVEMVQLSPPPTEPSAPPKLPEPFAMPRDLTKVSRDGLRTLAYQLEARLGELIDYYQARLDQAEDADWSAADKAVVRNDLEAMLDQDFRRRFEDNLKDLRAEIIGRIERAGGTAAFILPIPEMGLLDTGFISLAGDNVSSLARQMPSP